jgi:hypothetical protein
MFVLFFDASQWSCVFVWNLKWLILPYSGEKPPEIRVVIVCVDWIAILAYTIGLVLGLPGYSMSLFTILS